MSIYNKNTSPAQEIYDAFNTFIFCSDTNIFNKFVKRVELFNVIKHIPGDIVECGVFKGSGVLTWLKLVKLYSPNGNRRVIGFDMFEPSFSSTLQDDDRRCMTDVLARVDKDDLSIDFVSKRIVDSGFDISKFQLIKGDISTTSKKFADENIGFRIALLYMDLDIDKPTYDTLCNLWDRVVPGGLIVFDEYGYHCWSESNAVDRFCKNRGLKLNYIDCHAPTAYIQKEL
jgi:hypothetical protein